MHRSVRSRLRFLADAEGRCAAWETRTTCCRAQAIVCLAVARHARREEIKHGHHSGAKRSAGLLDAVAPTRVARLVPGAPVWRMLFVQYFLITPEKKTAGATEHMAPADPLRECAELNVT